MSNFLLMLSNLGLMASFEAWTCRCSFGVVRMMGHLSMYDFVFWRCSTVYNLTLIDNMTVSWSGRNIRCRYCAQGWCWWWCVRRMMTFIRLFLYEFVIVLDMLMMNCLPVHCRSFRLLMLKRRGLETCSTSMLMVLDFLVTDWCAI